MILQGVTIRASNTNTVALVRFILISENYIAEEILQRHGSIFSSALNMDGGVNSVMWTRLPNAA